MGKKSKTDRCADSIDRFLKQWRRVRPDLDPEALGVFGRVHRISSRFMRRTEKLLAGMGLGWESFSVIVTLRRSGPPFALRPTDLLHESLLSSGAMTNRIDRVEQLGLVRRTTDPHDRRAVMVKLTPVGRALADRAIKLHFEAMATMLSSLTGAEKRELARLLGKLLNAMERGPVARGALNASRLRCLPSTLVPSKYGASAEQRRRPKAIVPSEFAHKASRRNARTRFE